jgi:excinuclease UvrABC nuclease subunit
MFIIRDGKTVSAETKTMKQSETDQKRRSIVLVYPAVLFFGIYIPREIIVQEHPAEEELLINFLRKLRGAKTEIIVPLKGEKNACWNWL